ncbi:PREDICTED: uncharacterized protein LOC109175600 [Ipomoea nil]|uniref:uncharacterized protein LOC109175600 n=1 Tax=Ipomoea nil TaxID=35883 RepID=UPI000900AF29|nr:PREDICTED: uncharacterized protein LOC109175600 [Ipomoea nil]
MTTVPLLLSTTGPLLRGTQNFLVHIKATKWPHGSIKLGSLRTREKLVKFSTLNWNRGKVVLAAKSGGSGDGSILENHDNVQRRRFIQTILWIAEGVYVLWLFLLPYAPGDPVWRISSATVNDIVGLSLNFFFILPLSNIVGIHFLEAPVLHPMSEGLFNFVIGWTFMFAPLLFTDRKRDGYKGSLDVLWGLQMFLTNTFLIPYMAIRLNGGGTDDDPRKSTSELGSVMTSGARIVGLIGVGVCLVSTFWAIFGRGDGNFGDISERWEFVVSYLGSERLAYAFIWDICLYTIFQPWLIGDNLQNIEKDKVGVVKYLRFVPVVGLAAYCLCLNLDDN